MSYGDCHECDSTLRNGEGLCHECVGQLRARAEKAEARVAELTLERDAYRRDMQATEADLATAKARVAELEAAIAEANNFPALEEAHASIRRHAARVAELEAFVESVRRHILGECPGLTAADCIEAIRIDLHALEARTPADSVCVDEDGDELHPDARDMTYSWAELQAVRADTIEECAKVCEAVQAKHFGTGRDVALYCAEDIRKLATRTGSEGT